MVSTCDSQSLLPSPQWYPLPITGVELTFHRDLELGWVWRQELTGSKGWWELTVGSWYSGLSVYGSVCGQGPGAHPHCHQNTCWLSSGLGARWGVAQLSRHHPHAWVPPEKAECIRQAKPESFFSSLDCDYMSPISGFKTAFFVVAVFPVLKASTQSQRPLHVSRSQFNLWLHSACHNAFYGSSGYRQTS